MNDQRPEKPFQPKLAVCAACWASLVGDEYCASAKCYTGIRQAPENQIGRWDIILEHQKNDDRYCQSRKKGEGQGFEQQGNLLVLCLYVSHFESWFRAIRGALFIDTTEQQIDWLLI